MNASESNIKVGDVVEALVMWFANDILQRAQFNLNALRAVRR